MDWVRLERSVNVVVAVSTDAVCVMSSVFVGGGVERVTSGVVVKVAVVVGSSVSDLVSVIPDADLEADVDSVSGDDEAEPNTETVPDVDSEVVLLTDMDADVEGVCEVDTGLESEMMSEEDSDNDKVSEKEGGGVADRPVCDTERVVETESVVEMCRLSVSEIDADMRVETDSVRRVVSVVVSDSESNPERDAVTVSVGFESDTDAVRSTD